MSAGPTNRAVAFASAEEDPGDVVLRVMLEQGCTCPGGPTVRQMDPTSEQLADAEQYDVDVVSHVIVEHLASCPVLARTSTN